MYTERFPHRYAPHHTSFACTIQQLWKIGTLDVTRHNEGWFGTTCIPEYKEEVCHLVTSIPSVCTWQTADIMWANHMVIWCMLHEQLLHPYHPQRVQVMGPVGFPVWVQCSKWYLHQCKTQPTFPHLILFVDEACFTCEAMFNSTDSYVWDEDNHIPLFSDDTISTLQVSIWAGIVSDQFTGSYLPPIRLNVYTKLQLLQALPDLMRTCHYGYVNRCVPVRWSNNTSCANNPGLLYRLHQSMLHRYHLYNDFGRQHVEQLLYKP
jgi:hypothetical protein